MSEDKLLAAPVPPEEWECCNSDCGEACVWQLYYRDKAAYEVQQHALNQFKVATDEH